MCYAMQIVKITFVKEVLNNMAQIEVLFISSLCSESKYKWITEIRTVPSLDPGQRMFHGITVGLKENGCNVMCVSALPMGTSNTDAAHMMFARSEEIENGIHYIYPMFRIGKIRRLLDLRKNVQKEVRAWIHSTEGKKRFIICDSLLAMCTRSVRRLAQRNGIKVFAYVTDYPSMATSIKQQNVNLLQKNLQRAYDKYADWDLKKYDGYILVAEALKDLIGFKNKSYIVIEDVIATQKLRKIFSKDDDTLFTVVYGGALCERFGVNKLADAVRKIPQKNLRLCFYGSGESVEYIEKLCIKDSRIRYCGQVSFEQLQDIQMKANLLVNPRPSNESFAAYSFPSKTLSYMLSGTPVLTTRIPGIPPSYQQYLLWFDEEDVDSMAKKIEEIMNTSPTKLKKIGERAYMYVRNEKNSLAQSAKLLSFVEREING